MKRRRRLLLPRAFPASLLGARTLGAGLLCAGLLVASCSKPPDELERGVAAIRWMVSERFLRKSMFLACYEDPKPSDFVNYLFSTAGSAEWPEIEGAGADGAGSRGFAAPPPLPEGVRVRALDPDPSFDGPQVVVSYDDEAGEVVIAGFDRPDAEPRVVRRAKLPKVDRTDEERRIAEAFANSAREQGASAYDGLP